MFVSNFLNTLNTFHNLHGSNYKQLKNFGDGSYLQLLNQEKTYLERLRFVYPTPVVKYHAYHEMYLMDLKNWTQTFLYTSVVTKEMYTF